MAFFLKPHVAAEFDVGAAFRLGTMETGTLQIIRAVLDVRAELRLHLIRNLRTMEKLGGKRAKVGRQFHIQALFLAQQCRRIKRESALRRNPRGQQPQ